MGELADDLFRGYLINARETTDDVKTRWRLQIEPFFGSRRGMEVTCDFVAKYIDHPQSENASNATTQTLQSHHSSSTQKIRIFPQSGINQNLPEYRV